MLAQPQSTLIHEVPSEARPLVASHADPRLVEAASEAFFRPEGVGLPPTNKPVSMGTVIMALAYDGGVVLAADSRTSSGFVVNRVSNKLTKLSKKIYCCRSGSAADTQNLADQVGMYLNQHAISTKAEATVPAAAGLFHRMCYLNKWHISAGIIVAGWDSINGGQVFNIPAGGSCVRGDFALGGSGSIFLYGWMDAHFKVGMTRDQCINFAREAIAHALSRDASCGGVIRTMTIDKDGEYYTTTPWPSIPYCMEKDANYAKLAPQNQPWSSGSKVQDNQKDSTAQNK
jgi:20S proteasome subunit beta 1